MKSPRSVNTKRPNIKGAKRPYPPPMKVTQTQSALKAHMKRLRRTNYEK